MVMPETIEIDASHGGQVLRTALGLSALSGKAVVLKNIRASRPKPGIKAQHLYGTNCLAEICGARVSGNVPGSRALEFRPGKIKPVSLSISLPTAGSLSLILQAAMLPALAAEIKLRLAGGTDVAWSPPVNYLRKVLLPALRQMGANFSVELLSHGYFPKGMGRVSFSSKPAELPLKPLRRVERGSLECIKAFSHSASLPSEVSRNQLAAAKKELVESGLDFEFEGTIESRESANTIGSGIDLIALFSSAAIGANALGEKGKHATKVGREAAQNLLRELRAEKPVDSHLADQLIPYAALASGRSEFACTSLTEHTLANIMVCEKILGVKFIVEGSLHEPARISVDGVAFQKTG